jgi:hypothetical protein
MAWLDQRFSRSLVALLVICSRSMSVSCRHAARQLLMVVQELSAPMMVYTASPFVGPEIGPLIGGCA